MFGSPFGCEESVEVFGRMRHLVPKKHQKINGPYIGLIYGSYLQFRFLKWPLNKQSWENFGVQEELVELTVCSLGLGFEPATLW
jgi:hypothetical protein